MYTFHCTRFGGFFIEKMMNHRIIDLASIWAIIVTFLDALPHIAAGVAAVLAAAWWSIRVYREWRAAKRGDPL